MAESVERNDEVPVWAKREELAVQASIDFLNEGMARDALKLCNLVNSRDSSVVGPLMKHNNILGTGDRSQRESRNEISGTRTHRRVEANEAAVIEKSLIIKSVRYSI